MSFRGIVRWQNAGLGSLAQDVILPKSRRACPLGCILSRGDYRLFV